MKRKKLKTKWRECIKCFAPFVLERDKPGSIKHCPACSVETVEQVGGNMIYTHKTAPELEIKPISQAEAFAAKTRRLGAGVTASLTTSKEQAHKQLFGKSWT